MIKLQRETELLWRSEKYRVMYHSQYHYNDIRRLMRDHAPLSQIKHAINEALQVEPTNGSKVNAIQHMWGYFKKFASEDEKEMYKTYLQENDIEKLLPFLKHLSIQYNVRYLLESTILH